MPDKFFIGIPSGKLKGRKIAVLSNDKTRSTKNIVAQSFLNTLRFELRDAVFAELFGGSAFMAVCAISEGAKEAFVFEKDKNSFDVLKQNIKNLSLENSIFAELGDTFIVAADVLKRQNAENLILYLDPPFNVRAGFDEIYEKCLSLVEQINPKIAVFEHNSDVKLPQNLNNLNLIKSKKFGKSTLSYFFIKNTKLF